MTSLSNILGLMPVMVATGTGADVMKRIAAPMVGGVFTAMLLTLVVIPAVYVIWRWRADLKRSQPSGLQCPVATEVERPVGGRV
jgi:Cu(I)/Ag(I) efflux system membrane protein CusA/SilA